MNVGDRVRLLTGTEEGIVTRLLDSELVEVAIDNDFTIPVLRREVVVVAADESKNFDRTPAELGPGQRSGISSKKGGKGNASRKDPTRLAPTANAAPTPTLAEALAAVASSGPGAAGRAAGAVPRPGAAPGAPAAKGLFLALVPQTPELLAVTLLNNTEAEVLFTYGEETPARPYRALAAGQLGPRSSSKALAHFHLADFEQWAAVVVQLLPFRPNGDTAYDLLNKRQAFKASTFYGSRRPAPVIQKEAYLFQLDERPAPALPPEKLTTEPTASVVAPPGGTPAAPVLSAEALRTQLMGDATPRPAAAPTTPVLAPSHEVDLHLAALQPTAGADLSSAAALRLQLDAFADALSRALATNMHEIVFIHGLGNGTLRKEIHRQLSRHADIKFFEEAQREKFGFGATLVRLK